MDHLQTVNIIRQLVEQIVGERNWGATDEIVETILISKGYYSGRCYRYEQGHTCWIADVQQLQFFDLDNQLIDTMDVSDSTLQNDKTLQSDDKDVA